MFPTTEESQAQQPQDPKKALIEQLRRPMASFLTTEVRGDVESEKIYQYGMAALAEQYWRGFQYNAPSWNSNGTVGWRDISGQFRSGRGSTDGVQVRPINHYRKLGKRYVAILGQRAPSLKAVPDRDDDEKARRLARRADIEWKKLRSRWKVEQLQRDLALSLWKNGTTFGFLQFVADGEKNGYTEVPNFTVEQRESPAAYQCLVCGAETPAPEGDTGVGGMACSNCGSQLSGAEFRPPQMEDVPVEGKPDRIPNGAVEFRLTTIFDTVTAFHAKNVPELPSFLLEYEENIGRLITTYASKDPELAERLRKQVVGEGSVSSEQYGQDAREVAQSPIASPLGSRRSRALFGRLLLRPFQYELPTLKEETRALLKESFPNGVKLVFINNDLVDIEDEQIDDVVSACKPDTSEYLYADAAGADFIPIQDDINDNNTLIRETLARSIPWFGYDPTIFDADVFKERAMKVWEGVPMKAGVGQRAKDSVFVAPHAKYEPQVSDYMGYLVDTGGEVVAVTDQLYGGDTGSKTATEANQKRNAALQSLSTPWNEMRDFWCDVAIKAIRMESKYNGANDPDLAELLDGGFHFEAEEAMPQTWGAKRDLMFNLIQNPQAIMMFEMDQAQNAAELRDSLGVPTWRMKKLEVYEACMDAIFQLLQGSPVTNPMTGKVEPSIPINVFEDPHEQFVQIAKDWCLSEKGREAKRENPQGYSNVIAWGMAHAELMLPPPMPDQPGAPGDAPAPKQLGAAPPENPVDAPQSDAVPQNPTGLMQAPPAGTQPGGDGMSSPTLLQ
jgi:DNA-directed RNA polymerase subunit RPC12/RpoP